MGVGDDVEVGDGDGPGVDVLVGVEVDVTTGVEVLVGVLWPNTPHRDMWSGQAITIFWSTSTVLFGSITQAVPSQ